MKAFTLFSFFFGSIIFSFGQESLNQFDSAGKKDGRWIRYYNQYWKIVNDSSKAYFYCYTYFDHGARVHTKARWGMKHGKLVDSLAGHEHMGKIQLLDGKYTWYDNKGRLFATLYFDKGNPVAWYQYYKTGKLYLYFDYKEQVDGKPHTYWMYYYDKNGKLSCKIPVSRTSAGKWIS